MLDKLLDFFGLARRSYLEDSEEQLSRLEGRMVDLSRQFEDFKDQLFVLDKENIQLKKKNDLLNREYKNSIEFQSKRLAEVSARSRKYIRESEVV